MHSPKANFPHPRGRRALAALLLGLILGLTGCASALPTATPLPIPPALTNTPLLPTPTPAPPTATTAAPPSATPIPATATAAPPSVTPAPPRHVPVLAYHLINIPAGGEYNVSEAKFTAQMQWLHANDYHSISPAQLVAALTTGAPLPPHPVCITFDDNQVSPYVHALPVLKHYGFTAAFFIQTVTIGKDGFMDAAQIKDLADSGFTIGGHTWDHRILPQQIDSELQRQLDLSGADLGAILGHPPEYLSYPAGLYDQRVVEAVKAHGYKGAFRLYDRADPVVDPAFMIRRQIIAGSWGLDDFINNIHWMEAPPEGTKTDSTTTSDK
jgi:peptidoglycan/xylan/chitin deacetylase (PgdA/CDA1 family)